MRGSLQRLVEIGIVDTAVKFNPAKVRELMAEHLGYHEVAEMYRLEALRQCATAEEEVKP